MAHITKARCGFSADSGGRKRGFRSRPIGGGDGGGEGEAGRDELAQSLEDLFINVYTMIEGELQTMNQRVAEEYDGDGEKNHGFEEYVQQIEKIDQQVTEFEAVVSMLDKYVSLLENKLHSALLHDIKKLQSAFLHDMPP
ncbi:hypothetical protein C4D60_Mb04t09170 [Musa balbisiana]|uniref:Uncharacterized protein n=1 Tax=Musa balbisiana TaxID=52838 RepID=A0A4S8KAV3_MUSBA|nr:hypothetical protein C4D60_Mb04t09170 [Musa balbisiana]